MPEPDDDPIDDILVRSREQAARYAEFLDQLRAGDPAFAEASALHPDDFDEWQSSVYLLSGHHELWPALGAAVMADRSMAPVTRELDHQRRAWSTSERTVMTWSAHLWLSDERSPQVTFPWSFGEYLFRRWVTALHLRRHLAPALTVTGPLR
jgi:hypothetical protein